MGLNLTRKSRARMGFSELGLSFAMSAVASQIQMVMTLHCRKHYLHFFILIKQFYKYRDIIIADDKIKACRMDGISYFWSPGNFFNLIFFFFFFFASRWAYFLLSLKLNIIMMDDYVLVRLKTSGSVMAKNVLVSLKPLCSCRVMGAHFQISLKPVWDFVMGKHFQISLKSPWDCNILDEPFLVSFKPFLGTALDEQLYFSFCFLNFLTYILSRL